jgi:hypothetical protein
MENKEIRRIFYRDGYRMADTHLGGEFSAPRLKSAIAGLYGAVDELLESFLARTAYEGSPAQCKKGCAWCCYQEVFAVTHEFLYLYEFVLEYFTEQEQERVLERAREKTFLSLNLPEEQLLKIREACPFLEKGSCMIYQVRPMACRIYLSSSALSCKRDHDRPDHGKRIPELFEFPLLAGRMMNQGFTAYLKQSGIQSSELPMEQGYSSMVSMGQTMEDWIGSP